MESVREIVNNNEVREKISYSAYGTPTIEALGPPQKSLRMFTGREYEPETGDYYYRARYYDPKTGRFLSEDPIGFAAGDENLYRYVGNNPLIYNDPYGELAWGTVFKWMTAAIIKQIIGHPIKKTLTDAPIKNENQEIKDMYEEEKKKRERDREGCGIIKSCELKPQQCLR